MSSASQDFEPLFSQVIAARHENRCVSFYILYVQPSTHLGFSPSATPSSERPSPQHDIETSNGSNGRRRGYRGLLNRMPWIRSVLFRPVRPGSFGGGGPSGQTCSSCGKKSSWSLHPQNHGFCVCNIVVSKNSYKLRLII